MKRIAIELMESGFKVKMLTAFKNLDQPTYLSLSKEEQETEYKNTLMNGKNLVLKKLELSEIEVNKETLLAMKKHMNGRKRRSFGAEQVHALLIEEEKTFIKGDEWAIFNREFEVPFDYFKMEGYLLNEISKKLKLENF